MASLIPPCFSPLLRLLKLIIKGIKIHKPHNDKSKSISLTEEDFNSFLEDKKQMENWWLAMTGRSLDFRDRILEPRRQLICLAEPNSVLDSEMAGVMEGELKRLNSRAEMQSLYGRADPAHPLSHPQHTVVHSQRHPAIVTSVCQNSICTHFCFWVYQLDLWVSLLSKRSALQGSPRAALMVLVVLSG